MRHVTSTLTATDNVARVIATVQYHFLVAVWRAKEAEPRRVKRCWEIIADNLSKAGWSWGFVSAIEFQRANNLDCRHASTHETFTFEN
jgi:hypothetical protein